MNYNVGDQLMLQETTWSPFLRKYLLKGKIITIEDLDDIFFIPSLEKWIKI